MRIRSAALVGAVLLGLSVTAPAVGADKVPVKLKIKDCDGCSVMATWSKTGKATGKYRSKTKTAKGDTSKLTFKIPKGYYMYFTATSQQAQLDAASVVVTKFVGAKKGSKVSAAKASTLNDGASYCLTAKKRTIKVQAALVASDESTLLGLWANPQLKGMGTKIEDGIDGVYGTQNTLICKGKYY